MRVATWYVNGSKMNMHKDLIQQVNPHILAVQGLTLAGYDNITRMGNFDDWRFSMNLTEKKYTGRDRGVGIFVKYPYTIKNAYLIPNTPFAEKALATEIIDRDTLFLLGTADIPNGEDYRELKAASLLAFTQWMKEKKEYQN
ncbi:endonuclease/exonuclease/phosphatase family protein [Thermoactinomyces mirandus]|uniref:Endonuclease/exonuclease/phosphatase family protein n=1 Tax=Thermoactinomyces mirandus TaxID=2756294 RepID=A0A7W1XUC5_9BACL|nr:endonuclease/exonuclease/phosphatase family protein [Thermoactinomyces mirandus]MBA4603429.1 endonuclease/exonuclease/phosphatase family protein [Thermoactinomyces mirandus]